MAYMGQLYFTFTPVNEAANLVIKRTGGKHTLVKLIEFIKTYITRILQNSNLIMFTHRFVTKIQ
jgi:hypothetical protein